MIERVEITNLELEVGPKVFFAIAALNLCIFSLSLLMRGGTFDIRCKFLRYLYLCSIILRWNLYVPDFSAFLNNLKY